ncbi:MAG: ABC transporter substrate-binding protein [Gulosibacter sp.]|uniref:ABC transporter substrate-binding protein n=1 Tax=Gulosibacter sp. TaxID=2817531 RepID=UPI003F8F2B61
MKKKSRFAFSLMAAGLAIALAGCAQGGADASSTEGVPAEGPAGLVPENIADQGSITIATPATFPPEGYQDEDGSLAGYEIEIAEAVGEVLGLEVEWQITEFASMIPGLQSERFEMAAGQIGITPERAETIDFVTLILVNQAFAASADSGLTDVTIEDLCGMSVAVMQGSRQHEFGEEQSATCEENGEAAIDLNVFPTANDAWLAMQSDRVELYWNGTTNVAYLVDQADDAEIVGHHLEPYPTGLALPKDSELGPAVEAALQQLIDDGTYTEILNGWGLVDSGITEAELNPEITW